MDTDSSTCVCRIIAAGCQATEHDYDPIPDPVPDDPEVAALRAEHGQLVVECNRLHQVCRDVQAERDAMRADNANLRQLLIDASIQREERRQEVERMRPVVEAACDERDLNGMVSDDLCSAVDAFRAAQQENRPPKHS